MRIASIITSRLDSFEGGRSADDRDEEIARLRSKGGQLTMDVELLGQKCQHLESGRPFASRRRGT
jgi:hypothetical protein